MWRNYSTTQRVLDGLVSKGLVLRRAAANDADGPHYEISLDGQDLLRRLAIRQSIYLQAMDDEEAIKQCESLDLITLRYDKLPAGAPYICYQPWRLNLRMDMEATTSAWRARIKPVSPNADINEVGAYKTPRRALDGLMLYLSLSLKKGGG